ncbi:MAG: alpha-1,4-glucan--maltose-1-phosphate maltosyltransferase [Candidatus Limnocylindrales bacterium]
MSGAEERSRVVVENLSPRVDCGEFPVKRIVGDTVAVQAVAYADGHDAIACVLLSRRESETEWTETPMEPRVNDGWRATFTVREVGRYRYTVKAWVDRFATWSHDLAKRLDAEADVRVDLQIGAALVEAAAARATGSDAGRLEKIARTLRAGGAPAAREARSAQLAGLMARHAERPFPTMAPELTLVVDRELARFGAWYELFPRSATTEPGRHGTFRDVEDRLADVAEMGFDVLYLPPIHPIGRAFRKGRNGSPVAEPADPGSPWAIGASEGGHKTIHPELGTLEDFRHLVASAAARGIELALDIAFQCSPDHPYVIEHPEWFRSRPDGMIQYAENPPKKYQDIYPFDFETDAWRALWDELKSVVDFWIEQGVRIFRVDNPHTKPFAFWAWLINEVKAVHPDTIFLAEAFTRPNVLYRVAKLGFTQSYNYFPWRNTKAELTDFMTELTQAGVRDFFVPNLWPNTPDILPEQLQFGGRPAFASRLILAATLGPSYGIYGPAFEQGLIAPLAPGSEEYLDSEKYQIRPWDVDRGATLAGLVGQLNRIRRTEAAFRSNDHLRFHAVDNDQLIAYSKSTADLSNQVLVVVNLDPHHLQSGFVELSLDELRIDPHQPYQVHDLLTDARYLWHGPHNFVELRPEGFPANIFAIRRRIRTEHDFDYYL